MEVGFTSDLIQIFSLCATLQNINANLYFTKKKTISLTIALKFFLEHKRENFKLFQSLASQFFHFLLVKEYLQSIIYGGENQYDFSYIKS